ncbi:hypothetical protein [Pelosinus sp. sgz500959]|uniref:hypothetical protein n=1 Tax=Pelosinus sp. sgz500959 TaxID=3242472 RepID=UPI00366AC84C
MAAINITRQSTVTLTDAGIAGPPGTDPLDILTDGNLSSGYVIYAQGASLSITFTFPSEKNISAFKLWSYSAGGTFTLFADGIQVEIITGASTNWLPEWSGTATVLTVSSTTAITEVEILDNPAQTDPVAFNSRVDTVRQVSDTIAINADTLRPIFVPVVINANTKRIIVQYITAATNGIKSISIQTGMQSLSDRFTIESVDQSFAGTDNFTGSAAGFQFQFEKAETRESISSMGTTYTTTGRPDMSNFLFGSVRMNVGSYIYNGGRVINATAKSLCTMIGVDASNITNFTPLGIGSLDEDTGIFKIKEKSKKAFLDKLFGWTGDFADRQIYYTNRNGKVVANEVRKYTIVYDLNDKSKYRVENSNIQRQRIRKFVDTSESSDDDPSTPTKGDSVITINPNSSPFSGTTTFGESSLTYSNGLLRREVATDSTTTYDYEPANSSAFNSSKNVLKSKNTLSTDGTKRSTTTYEYDVEVKGAYESSDVDVSLTSENTIVENKENGVWTIESNHKIYHVPLGNGFFGQRVVEIDGENHVTVANSISRGSPGGLASMYTIERYAGYTITPPDNVEKPKDFIGELCYPVNIPVAEINIVNDLIAVINWMDKKIEEVINLSVVILPGADLVDAVQGALTYKDNLYYIQSTNATVNDKGTRQQITAIRWY